MNKWLLSFIVLIVITIVGCSKSESSTNEMTGSKPPIAMIKIGEETFLTKLGSYCWTLRNKSTCVDTAGPVELLKNENPIQVKAGEEITFEMDYEPKPNEFHVIQINENNETEIVMEDNHFTAPMEKGVYYYSYGVWWMDKKEANVSNGDAFYAFVLEVR
ncbi:hypothetical protein [Bacillus massilinigeriensis]|uniref:hypothetical protein n=1 Tax=Bacillus massilionigeriensis TaxID=1805475 RepID=UPI00096ADDE4|nr:hypothetical protein [Bacillus massilionigeriensis]